jgi:8-oxo-dGTP pyrophosphatase MutT (NUDIX family)
MKRSNLLHLLGEYKPVDGQEIIFKEMMISFIQRHEDCFERSLKIGHITASAWLINKNGTHALLMHHAKLNRWLQPGGHCDGNPNTREVALKEAREESGIYGIELVGTNIFDIDIHLIPTNAREQEHYHYDVRFLLKVTSDENIIQNSESTALRWIGKNRDELPTDNQSIIRMFEKWIKNDF